MVKKYSEYTAAQKFLLAIVIIGSYFTFSYFTFFSALTNDNVLSILPANGLALSFLFLFGASVLPFIISGSLLFNCVVFYLFGNAQWNATLSDFIALSAFQGMQVYLAYYLFNKWIDTKLLFNQTQQIFVFAFVCLISAAAASIFEWLLLRGTFYVSVSNNAFVYATLIFGNFSGLILITPFVLMWFEVPAPSPKNRGISEMVMIFLLAVFMIVFLNTDVFNVSSIYKKSYLTIPILLWAAFRANIRVLMIVWVSIAVSSFLFTVNNIGPFTFESVQAAFLSSQIYVSIVTFTILLLYASITQRNQSQLLLEKANKEISHLAEERNKKLIQTQQEIADYQMQISEIFNVLSNYAELKFDSKAVIYNRNKDLDGIANGINKIGLEMQAYILSEQKYIANLQDLNSLITESEQRIKTIFNNAPDSIIVVDSDGKVIIWNPTSEKIFGWTNQEIEGKCVQEFIIPNEFKAVYERGIESAIKNTKYFSFNKSFEIKVINKKGNFFFVSVSISPIIMNGQQLYIAFLRDVTAKKKIESEIKQSQLFLNSVVENIPTMLFIKDATELRFVRFNKAGEDLLGFTREELMGKNDYDFFDKSEADFFVAKDREVLNSKAMIQIAEENIHTKNKGVRILATKKIPLYNENGEPQFLLGISNDITEEKAKQELLQKNANDLMTLSKELTRSNKELEQFAYVASHDLQEPLRTITSYVQLISKRYSDKLDSDAGEFMQFITDASNRMRNLINSLLEYSRVNRVKPFENFEVKTVIDDVLKDLQNKIKETKATIWIGDMPTIYGDPVLISQLFLNLISNAIKFRGEYDPMVEIDCKLEKGYYNFIVKDKGIGIQKEYYDKIFVIFQRLHSIEKYPGTGIGLAICKKIVERHGGEISLESTLGKGTTFHFSIREKPM
jgi:PAS domain S-box-containing protein